MTSVAHKDIHEMSCAQDDSGTWVVMYRATVRVEKDGVHKEGTGYATQAEHDANAARGAALDGALDMALKRALASLGEQPPAATHAVTAQPARSVPASAPAANAASAANAAAAAAEAQKKKEAELQQERVKKEEEARRRREEAEEAAAAEEENRRLQQEADEAEAEAEAARIAAEKDQAAKQEQDRRAKEEEAKRAKEQEDARKKAAEEEARRKEAAAAAEAEEKRKQQEEEEQRKKQEEEEKEERKKQEDEEKAKAAAELAKKSPRAMPARQPSSTGLLRTSGAAPGVPVKGRNSPLVTPAAGAGPRKQLSLSSRKNVKQFQTAWNEHAARLQETLALSGQLQSKVDWVPLADKCDEGGHKFACGEVFYDKIFGGLVANLSKLAGTGGCDALVAQWVTLAVSLRFDEAQQQQWSAAFVDGGDLELVSRGEPWLETGSVGADLVRQLLPAGGKEASNDNEEMDEELGLPMSAATSLRELHSTIEAAEHRLRDAAGFDFDIVVDIDYVQLLEVLGSTRRSLLGGTWLAIVEKLATALEDVVARCVFYFFFYFFFFSGVVLLSVIQRSRRATKAAEQMAQRCAQAGDGRGH